MPGVGPAAHVAQAGQSRSANSARRAEGTSAREEAADALDAFGEPLDGAGVRKAHVLRRAMLPEVETGRDRDAGLLKEVEGEAITVVREARAFGVHVERTLRHLRNAEAEDPQRRHEIVPPPAKCLAPRIEERQRRGVESGLDRALRRRGRRAAAV